MPRVGLTLGKYAPLHKGHQFLFETALREVDHLIVLIYDARETDVPLPVRASWIRRLHPRIEVIEAWGGPAENGTDPELVRAHNDYILELLGGRAVTHFFSGEPYGAFVSRALGAHDRRVDEARTTVPVSARHIRRSPYEWRAFVDPLVYRDLVTTAVFVGAPSTGKTTLAEALARRFDTAWVPEYGREYWARHQVNHRLTLEQLVEIAHGHRAREEAALADANRYLFIDTEAMITRLFSRHYHGTAHPELDRLADESARRYDLFFLCDDDIPFDPTDRSGEANRTLFQRWMLAELAVHRIPFVRVHGSLEERIAQVETALARYRKFGGSTV